MDLRKFTTPLLLLSAINVNAVYSCQTWCYILSPNRLYLVCCNQNEKFGFCPTNHCLYDGFFDLQLLSCFSDKSCPPGYKCCPDDCYVFSKICKPLNTNTYFQYMTTVDQETTTQLINTTDASLTTINAPKTEETTTITTTAQSNNSNTTIEESTTITTTSQLINFNTTIEETTTELVSTPEVTTIQTTTEEILPPEA